MQFIWMYDEDIPWHRVPRFTTVFETLDTNFRASNRIRIMAMRGECNVLEIGMRPL